MERTRAAFLCVLSGLLLLGAFPPFNFAPLVFFALVPWLLSLSNATNKGALKRGYLFGLVFALGQLHWLDALTESWTHSAALALVPWLLAAGAMAVYFGLMSMAARVFLIRGMAWCVPLVWAGMEVFRSYIPVLAFPWGLLALPLWRYPALIQDARLGTIYLCGGWVVLVNVALFLWLGKPARTAVWYGAVAAVLLVTSLILYEVGPETSSVPVLVGQTGADMAFGDPLVTEAKTTAAMDRMVHQAVASGSRLTVFPEGVARMGDDFSSPPFHLDRRAPTLFGAQRGTGPVYQSAVGYDGTFKIADKTRLVIFGEFVPGRGVLPFLSAFHLPSGDLSSGEHGTQAVRLGSLVVGPLICFEGLFPDLAFRQSVNGAQILAVMSDDDWFMGSSAPDELKAGSIWRAVESGLPLVRSASLGYSLAVDGHGRILAEAPLGQEDALQVSVPVPDRPIVLWFQPAFPLIFLGIFLGAPLIARQKAISSFLIMVQ